MKKPTEDELLIGGVVLFFIWVFVVLPILSTYQAYQYSHPPVAPHAGETEMAHVDWLVAFVTFLLFIATLATAWTAWVLGSRQEEIQKSLAKFSQNAQLIPVWEYISSLDDINPKGPPVVPDVVKAANTLEFVAILIKTKVIDRDVVLQTFETRYVHLCTKILECPFMEGINKTGQQVMEENPAALALYKELQNNGRRKND